MRLEKGFGLALLVVCITWLANGTEQTSRGEVGKCNNCSCFVSSVFQKQGGSCFGARVTGQDGKAGDVVSIAIAGWANPCSANPNVTADNPQVNLGWYDYGNNCTTSCQGQVGAGAWIAATINEGATYALVNGTIKTNCTN
jgi:hypothetical protein